ncbi:MAG: hypothetical protein H6Q89_56 [Myxococcaceae bacterium]|nr:hypothetical protein [Myxococcaceae bacterium]
MASSRGKSQARKVIELPLVAQAPEVPAEIAASPLYGVAMLKIAMELKKADARPLEELVSSVLQRMHLPEEDFRQFLASNGGLLRTIALKQRY